LAQSTFKTNASNSHVPNYNGNISRHTEKKQTLTAIVSTSMFKTLCNKGQGMYYMPETEPCISYVLFEGFLRTLFQKALNQLYHYVPRGG